MSAHVLLNSLNDLWKRDNMRDLSSILSLFRSEFDKVNNTGARMLDLFITHYIKISRIFGVKTSIICHLLRNVKMDIIT